MTGMSGRIAPARAIRRDLTARQGLTLAVAALTAVAVLDLLDGSLGIVFGVGFALTVITVALWTEPSSLFIAGIAPPFLMLGAITLIAIAAPLAIDTSAGTGQAALLERILAGLLNQAIALVAGHVSALILIWLRRLTTR